MTENEVNNICYQWIVSQGYKYKGILNKGLGQVEVPSGERLVLIDHQGIKDTPIDMVWIEAKGSDVGLSMLLEGFIRVLYACYYGGGKGLLATPNKEYNMLVAIHEFLANISKASEKIIGLLNANTYAIYWF